MSGFEVKARVKTTRWTTRGSSRIEVPSVREAIISGRFMSREAAETYKDLALKDPAYESAWVVEAK